MYLNTSICFYELFTLISGIFVQGSHSTKVEAVVKCLLNIRKEDPKAKSLVFSTVSV